MLDILHRIVIEAEPKDVYKALIEQEKLSGWWTRATAEGEKGSIASFFFGPDGSHQVDMEIQELIANKRVEWKCVSGPWAETDYFRFDIAKDERGTELKFAHSGWQKNDEFFMHCNSKWGFFLTVSLKNLLEKGKGQPHPEDPSI